jgi:nucleotide-binding universal stress UspA family protein
MTHPTVTDHESTRPRDRGTDDSWWSGQGSNQRVLVLYEPGRAGIAALDLARKLVIRDGASLTVVSVVSQASTGTCGASSALAYNRAVADSVADDLEKAREHLGVLADAASFRLLVQGQGPSLEDFAAAGRFDLVLLPGHRRPLRAASHPDAKRLRMLRRAEVRIVEPARGR